MASASVAWRIEAPPACLAPDLETPRLDTARRDTGWERVASKDERESAASRREQARPRDPAPVFLDARTEFASRFLAGDGLEIGASTCPADAPQARKYVDRMSADQLRSEYPELGGWDLTPRPDR